MKFSSSKEKPKSRSYLHLTSDDCKILDASEMWGKDTKETQDWLTETHGKNTRAACIGRRAKIWSNTPPSSATAGRPDAAAPAR